MRVYVPVNVRGCLVRVYKRDTCLSSKEIYLHHHYQKSGCFGIEHFFSIIKISFIICIQVLSSIHIKGLKFFLKINYR